MAGAGFPEPYTFSRRVYAAPARPARRVRPRPRQPVPRPRPPRPRPRRLAVRQHAAPPDHRRPRPRPRRRDVTVPPPDPPALVRLPRHADGRRPPVAPPHHGVAQLEEGHRRPDAGASRHIAHRAGGRRPEAVPPAPAHRSRAGPVDDDRERRRPVEGSDLSHRGAGQGPHRTRRRASRRHRPAAPQVGGARADRTARAAGRDRVRERRDRRAHRRALRRGRDRGRALPVRGFLAPGHRGHGVRRAPGHHDGRRVARGRRLPRRRRDDRAARRSRRARADAHRRPRQRRAARPARRARPRAACSTGSRGARPRKGPRSSTTSSSQPTRSVVTTPGTRADAHRRLRPPRIAGGRTPARPRFRRRSAHVRSDAPRRDASPRSTTRPPI